jgi:hypothetical protein
MIRKTALVLLTLILMMISFNPLQVLSRSDSAVQLIDSVTTSFPDYIEFKLDIETEIFIRDIRLHYFVERESFNEVIQEIIVAIPMPFQSETSIRWTWDMRTTGSLPSGR